MKIADSVYLKNICIYYWDFKKIKNHVVLHLVFHQNNKGSNWGSYNPKR